MESPSMKKPRTATLLVFALAGGALVSALCPRSTYPADSLEFGVSDVERRLAETRMILQCAKGLITQEVIQGRQPLLDAAALFGALNRLSPDPRGLWVSDVDNSQWRFPAGTDEEKLCRQVVAWVSHRTLPDQADAVVARLAAEYRWELHTRGAIGLPDPAGLEPVQELLARVRKGLTESELQCLFGNPRQRGSR